MEQQQIEQASDLIIDTIANSNLDNCTKLELLINMKTFFESYNENILILQKGEKNENNRIKRIRS